MAERPLPARSGHIKAGVHDVWWEYFGHGDREVICLLNGLAMDVTSWYGLLPRLQPEFDVLLFDYPGQGRSSSHDVPCTIPEICKALDTILDEAGISAVHVVGISYGGFIALDFARLFLQRVHTLTLSGILLSHEELFSMYQELSLRFYRGSAEAFEIYAHYMYEKIFGERFIRAIKPKLETMRANFHDRWKHKRHSLIRLTEAQDPFFAELDANLPGYRAIDVPTLVLAGAEDRAIPWWVQRKITGILTNTRFELVPDSGHVTYLERADYFFDQVTRLARTKSLAVGAEA